MKFEEGPTEDYKHGLVFESAEGEVEAVAAAYRERLNLKAAGGKLSEIHKNECAISQWANSPDQTLLVNHPLQFALFLERFSGRTEEAVLKIIKENHEPDFDSDAVARRIDLGSKALQLAGFIKLEFDSDTLELMLDQQGADLFTGLAHIPEQPFD